MAKRRQKRTKKKDKSWDKSFPILVGVVMAIGVALAYSLSGGSWGADDDEVAETGRHVTATVSDDGDDAQDDPEPAEEAPAGNAPETVSARHILIQYEGSARAGANITRTQEEARTEAEAIAARAGADLADFEALAREHSDGPSGPNGGDLGNFGRSRMHPAFEAAAFGLAVDEVSGVVETPFGYHVIQRYQ